MFFKHKDEGAEEVKRYAQSKEGVEQEEVSRKEHYKMPSTPQNDEPNTGIATPPPPGEV